MKTEDGPINSVLLIGSHEYVATVAYRWVGAQEQIGQFCILVLALIVSTERVEVAHNRHFCTRIQQGLGNLKQYQKVQPCSYSDILP